MGEKFNSGYGGYICDCCRKLLWAGRNGLEDADARRYIYHVQPEDVVLKDGLAFCSKDCADKGEHP